MSYYSDISNGSWDSLGTVYEPTIEPVPFIPESEQERDLLDKVRSAAENIGVKVPGDEIARSLAYGIAREMAPDTKVRSAELSEISDERRPSRNLFCIQEDGQPIVAVHLNKERKGDRNLGSDGSMEKALQLAFGYNLTTREISVYVVNSWAPVTEAEKENFNPRKRGMIRQTDKKQYQSRESCDNEHKIHTQLRGHPNTLPMIASVEQRGKSGGIKKYLFLPYCEGGDLRRLIRSDNLTSQGKVRIALQVINGLEQMHRSGIAHRDLTSGNIFFKDGEAYIADFGISVEMGQPLPDGNGTPQIRPPEFMTTPHAVCTPESDVYSLGCTLYEMMYGRHLIHDAMGLSSNPGPFPILNFLLKLDKDPMEKPANLQSFEGIIYQMTRYNPEERITLQEARAQLEALNLDGIARTQKQVNDQH